jgi:hypothetical protein
VLLTAFLLVNLLVVAGWWLLLVRHLDCARRDAAVYTGVLLAVQLYLGQLALAASGVFARGSVLLVLALVTLAVIALACTRRAPAGDRVAPALTRAASRPTQAGFDPLNLVLAALVGVLVLWLLVAAWLLPPRGVDDLAYHLPPLYETVATGRLPLLPLELRAQFALPLAGGFLALWPLTFFHADTWIDAVGIATAGYCALATTALARTLGATPRDALTAGLLFLLTPVAMAQAASNYVDLPVVAAGLALWYAVLRYSQEGRALHLVLAALAGGYGLGVKYNMALLIATAQPLLLLALWRQERVRSRNSRAGPSLARLVLPYAGYLLLTFALPAYWLVRNQFAIGAPLYPYALSASGLADLGAVPWDVALASGDSGAGPALAKLLEEPLRLLGFLWRDPGLGSLNGGLGLVFLAFGLPALAWCLARSIDAARRGDWAPLTLWAAPPLVFLLFLQQVDAARLQFNMRLLLVLVPFALVALALYIGRLRSVSPLAATLLGAVLVAVGAVSLAHLAGNRLPGLDPTAALADRRAGTVTTAQRYYREAHGDLGTLAAAYEPLDWLTREGPGWNVYMAAAWSVFAVTPLYGSAVQNRVWNFLPEPRPAPDAMVFHAGIGGGLGSLYYVRGALTPADAQADPRYELLVREAATELWVARARLAEPATRARLLAYYRLRQAADIAAVAAVLPRLPAVDLVVGSAPLMAALRYHELSGALAAPVQLVAGGEEAATVRRTAARRVITVGVPLPGAQSRAVAELRTRDGLVRLFYSEVTP